MNELLNMSLYSPGSLKPEDLLAGFVARQKTLAYFCAELRYQAQGADPRHHLIIGQRGMGKTTLLHRIALVIAQESDLSAYFVPLTFREEQYNVINLHLFWRNAIEALLDWMEQRKLPHAALEAQLDNLETAYAERPKEQTGGDAAWGMFRQACQDLHLRPVLFLDNIDLILTALKKHAWGLRNILQQNDGPLVIGAAANYPQDLSNKNAAFFDFFRITTLQRLDAQEVRICLNHLAEQRVGNVGGQVKRLLQTDPGRIAALTEMTGGNPRTLALLYVLLESQIGADAFGDLERLLDMMTPFYKARAEEAAPQSRAVLDAVALAWDPVTAAQVAKSSGLDVTTVNAQLKRLENDGFIEPVSLYGTGRSGYQIVERFFNIWYLMRHSSRRGKQRLRWLTCFLRDFYSADERKQFARYLLRPEQHKGRSEILLALSESLDDPVYRRALNHAVGSDWLQQSETRSQINAFVDLSDLDAEQLDMAALRRKVLALQCDWPEPFDAQSAWLLLGGSLELSRAEKSEIIVQLAEMPTDKLIGLLKTLEDEINTTVQRLAITLVELSAYRKAISEGSIRHCLDLQGACATALREDNPSIAAVGCLLALKKNGDLSEIKDCLQRYAEQDEPHWRRIASAKVLAQPETAKRASARGSWLHKQGYYQDAEAAYRRAIELDDKPALPWNGLGNLLQYHLQRYEEAEAAYRRAIELDDKLAFPWYRLGDLLQYRLHRYEEAETAYRRATELDDKYAPPWIELGNLLGDHLQRYEAAEAAYRRAIELEGESVYTWVALGNILQNYLGRFKEAEAAYLQALQLQRDDPYGLANLAYLYWLYLDEPAQAHRYAEQARTQLDPCGIALLDAAQALAEDSPGVAWRALNQALAEQDPQLWTTYIDDLQRMLRYAVARGYGEHLQRWMEQQVYPERYAPLYWAYLALLQGEALLQNVNPEVRTTAERLYRGLAALSEPRAAK